METMKQSGLWSSLCSHGCYVFTLLVVYLLWWWNQALGNFDFQLNVTLNEGQGQSEMCISKFQWEMTNTK